MTPCLLGNDKRAYHCSRYAVELLSLVSLYFRFSYHVGKPQGVPYNMLPENVKDFLPFRFTRTNHQ